MTGNRTTSRSVGGVGEQRDEPVDVDADSEAGHQGHFVFHRLDEVLLHHHGLVVAGLAQRGRLVEPLPLPLPLLDGSARIPTRPHRREFATGGPAAGQPVCPGGVPAP
jgi:hypothetical protein